MTRFCRIGTEQSRVEIYKATRERRYGGQGAGGSKVAEDITVKKKGTGQNSMNRIEHEKNCPTRMQESGRVIGGKEEVLFTPVKETGDTTVGQSVERR